MSHMQIRSWMGRASFVGIVGALGVVGGCAAPAQEELEGSSSAALAASDFASQLDDVDAAYESCVRAGRCADTDGALASDSSTLAAGLRPQSFRSMVSGRDLCTALGKLGVSEHAYFFVGASVTGGAAATPLLGTDIVWDLYNRQLAAFAYAGGGVASVVGIEGSAYLGFGFGHKDGVVDAWSGRTASTTLSVGIPGLRLGVGATGFTSLDGTVKGGAVSASFGLNVIPTPAEAAVDAVEERPWNAGTNGLRPRLWLVGFDDAGTTYDQKTYAYLRLRSPKDVALSILELGGVGGGGVAAAGAIAVGILRARGLTVSQVCGAR
jgi:hypothetical protein